MSPMLPISVGISSMGLMLGASDPTVAPGPDYAGIAALITAITGLLGTFAALVLGLRKRQSSQAEAIVAVLLEKELKRLQGGEETS